jgi:hypothetical protein
MSEPSKPVAAFTVEKFFPPRCPDCGRDFASPQDFSLWAGDRGTSLVDSLINQLRANPELYSSREGGIDVNRFNADFIICNHCKNKTFRIHYGEEQVLNRREAERLVSEAGFTSISEGFAYGSMATRRSTLYFLGTADLARLTEAAHAARRRAASAGEDQPGDVFASVLDPALEEMIPQLRASQALDAARVRLSERFDDLWSRLSSEAQQFLATGEVLLDSLKGFAAVDPTIDFSPAVGAYSKALEREVLDKLFLPLRDGDVDARLPRVDDEKQQRSLETLRSFMAGARPLSLGEASYVLQNVGCRLRDATPNAFADFLYSRLHDRDAFCDEDKFPSRVQKYVMKYRNAAAHVERLSAEDCEGARAYLLEEPIQLLLTLARSVRTTPTMD